MKILNLIGVVILGWMTMGAVYAAAEKSISFQEYYFEPDSDRPTQGRGFGTDLTISWPLQHSWVLETRLIGTWIDDRGNYRRDAYRVGAGIDFRYDMGDPDTLSPYLIGGVGVVRNLLIPEDDETGATANLGVGWMSGPINEYGIRLRGDLRVVYDDFADGMVDWRAGMGVQIPLRKPQERVVEVPVEKIVFKEKTQPARPIIQDADGDGVADQQDACPNTLTGAVVDKTGCAYGLREIKGVTFLTDSAHLTPNARQVLDHVVRALRGQPNIQVQVLGYTDAVGATAYNQRLSERRALAVRDYLISQGIQPQRLRTGAFGESRPAADNASKEGRELNRRVEIRIAL